ncbi:hypothetical protein HGRIS_011887 [Hohenbuehelia grisea]|uniref:P-loop containing nucleoside triphosphate hydrolase protein n=1 Tax=Hohenbuehelia grisea TaxID=104357 RepID=A0ABR3JWM7_9AGAR
MDLEHFDDADLLFDVAELTSSASPAITTLQALDAQWYSMASRRARWMDLLGDYAGAELFIIDGESLLQLVLDDELLHIGRKNDLGFQLLHAIFLLEHRLNCFLQRNANFEIVFWNENRHLTLKTGSSILAMSSRSLARETLFRHVLTLGVPVSTFDGLSDIAWLAYESVKKPMFVMMNDGGQYTSSPFAAERLSCQRLFLHELLKSGLAVALLNGAEYRDSQILTFIHEQRSRTAGVSPSIVGAVQEFRAALDEVYRQASGSKEGGRLLSPSHDQDVEPCSRLLERISASFLRFSFQYASELLFIFLAHCLILDMVSAEDRARSAEELPVDLAAVVTRDFYPSIFFTIAEIMRPSTARLSVDGHVFVSLINQVLRHRGSIQVTLGTAVYEAVQSIWTAAGGLPLDFLDFAASFPLPPQPITDIPRTTVPSVRLLPFEHPVLADALSLVDIPESELEATGHDDTIFLDTRHWHNGKRTIISKPGQTGVSSRDKRREAKERRSNQRFMASMQLHAGTLTGAMGAALQQIVVTPVGQSQPALRRGNLVVKNVQKQPAKSNKKAKPTSKQILLKEIADKRLAEQANASDAWWRDQLRAMASKSAVECREHLNDLSRNPRTKDEHLAVELLLYRIHIEFSAWSEDPEKLDPERRDAYSVQIMRLLKDVAALTTVPSIAARCVSSALLALGFRDSLIRLNASKDERQLSFKFLKLIKSGGTPKYDYMINSEDPTTWQLRLFGEYMDRSMDSAPDHRVNFAPDAWQRRVLDCVDRNESILVVAPTSAGKTFISFYAMEKVLRESDDGILVYIAPTKALVSQIAAEVYARFSKNLDEGSFWAIHTRDYRVNDPQKCQILVTVPEMLAIMLLSPPLARVWTPRIKRIILDEIHSIGQQEGGAVWEQIILLAPCPIIGLSATIGSPEAFNSWLSSVQVAHGHQHSFIEHPHRYSHLRKFYYALERAPTSSFSGLNDYKPTGRTRFLHPLSALSFGTRLVPEDLALEAADALTLYETMRKVLPRGSIEHLEPAHFFANDSGLLRQKDVIRYETALKAFLAPMISSFDPSHPTTDIHNIIHLLRDPLLSRIPPERLNEAPSRKRFISNLIYLLSDLNSSNNLPAILFNFDRTDCEIMAQAIVNQLMVAETQWKATSSKWARKLQQWEVWKANAKARQRAAEKAAKAMKRDAGSDAMQDSDNSWERTFDPQAPLPNFSFVGLRSTYTTEELNSEIKGLSRWTSTPSWALYALRRGIAVHHSGMNKRYRSLVESLFRQGFIRVVIATGTLALGINAPTKTSVFCGDSPFLTALMYRQCAGRAGRRGFDLRGNVVFYGLPMDRVQRLILSKLSSLTSSFPLTTTLSLRLLNLLEGSDRAEVSVKAIQSLLTLPRLSFGSSIGRHQLVHHLRFSIEYLRRAGLLDAKGTPLNFFGVAAHLYFHEPSNFALVALIRRGILHGICAQKSLVQAKRDLILLMSHLFGRRYISRSFANQDTITALRRKYPSVITLPELDQQSRQALLEHDAEILALFNGYACLYASQYAEKLGSDCVLPISKQDHSEQPNIDAPHSPFVSYLRRTRNHVVARSVFAANSGHTDSFQSVAELVDSARQGLHFNLNVIPSVAHIAQGGEGEHALNAYIFDFYTHGQVATLVNANGIRRGDIWYLLQDFMLSLMTIRTAFEQMMDKQSVEKLEASRVDPAEQDKADEEQPGGDDLSENEVGKDDNFGDEADVNGFKRPRGVSDSDWRVYEVLVGALTEFEAKFRAMWA